MANFTNTTQLTELSAGQAQKEVTANANFRASSPANSFARNDNTSSLLSWAYYGGTTLVDNVPRQLTSGTITNMPISKTNNIHLELGRVSATTIAITGISVAAAAIITVASHNFVIGDIGYISTAVAGMLPIQGTFFKVTAFDATHVTTDIISTGFAAWTSGGTIAKVYENSGTVTVGKTHILHTPICKPLYTLTTNTTAITGWIDYRMPDTFKFNSSVVVANGLSTTINATSYTSKYSAGYDVDTHTSSINKVSTNTGSIGVSTYNTRSRGTLAVPLIVQDTDILSTDFATGFDGLDYAIGGYTRFLVSGTPTTDAMPTKYEIATSGAGSQAPTTRVTIGATGTTFNADNIIINTSKTPATATDTGTTGQICWDSGFIYVCTATNTWVRSAITTW